MEERTFHKGLRTGQGSNSPYGKGKGSKQGQSAEVIGEGEPGPSTFPSSVIAAGLGGKPGQEPFLVGGMVLGCAARVLPSLRPAGEWLRLGDW